MKIVYVAHPISGDVKGNIDKVLSIVRAINLQCYDVLPFAPYIVDLMALDDSVELERSRGIRNNIHLFKFIDEVWVFADENNLSNGVASEVRLAAELGIKVLYNPKI